jgi:hypothetical protein
MRFPVLVRSRRSACVTHFRLIPRACRAFVLSDDFTLQVEECAFAYDFFLFCARRFFPHALNWQLDWPLDEQAKLRSSLQMAVLCRIEGDSWSLPLFFAFDCLHRRVDWPERVLVSGAVRQCRGVRCAAIGGARHKLRQAQALGCLCLLPRANIGLLRRQNMDVASSLALPPNLDACLSIWRGMAASAHV